MRTTVSPPKASVPPEPTGKTLLELDRGQNGTLRLALDHYEGNPYVSMSLWKGGWPVRGKSLSFRLRELPSIIAALTEAMKA